jgi:hypothetical protein
MLRSNYRRGPGLGRARQVIASVAVSGFGTWCYNVGIAVYAFDRTHSATWVAIVTVGRYVPALVLSWLARSWVDRLPRRTVAMAADLGCAVVMVLLAVAGALNAPLWLIIVCAAGSSTLARIQASAVLSLAADVVVESVLARAGRLIGAAESIATAAGSAFASALLVHFSPPALFVVNAASFAASALVLSSLHSIRPRRSAPRADGIAASSRSTISGWSSQAFWPLQAARGLAAYAYGVDIVLLTVIANRQFHSGSGAGAYGWLLAAAGLGGLLSVAPIRRNIRRTPNTRLLTAGLLGYALPLVFFALEPPIAGGIAIQIARGFGSVLVTAGTVTALQRAVPSVVAGRVFGTTQSLVLVGTCAGALSAPALLGSVGFTATVVISALAPAAAAIALAPFLARFNHEEASLLVTLDPRLAVMRNLDLLRDASRSTLYEIADSVTEIEVEGGSAIVSEGEPANDLYVLATGTVEVTTQGPDGPILLRELSAPDYFGEIGVLQSVPRTATVTASRACTLWRIPAAVFLAGVAEAGISGALSDTIAVRSAQTTR